MKKDNKIILQQFFPDLPNLTDEEIEFSRYMMDRLIEYQDFTYEFFIETNPLDFRRFLIYNVRQYTMFHKRYKQQLPSKFRLFSWIGRVR